MEHGALMEKTQKQKTKKQLPAWAGWLAGYAAVLALSAGLVYYWRVVFSLDEMPAVPLTLWVMGLFSLLYLALFLLCRLKGERGVCLKAALCVLALGLLFCFGTAPLQVPDETKYFLRTEALSRGQLVPQYQADFPEDVDLLVQHFFAPGTLPMNHRVSYQGGQLAPAAFEGYLRDAGAGVEPAIEAEAPLLYTSLPFLPGALFMAVGRLLGLGALGLLYAGRLANLLVYAAIAYFTFKNAGRHRGVFFAFALLPLSLFMAASCSSDSLMLALCYFAASIVVRQQVGWRELALFAAAVAVANYIKPLNFILVALLLLVPRKSWKLKWKPWVIALGALAAVLVFQLLLGEVLDRNLSYLGGWGTYEELPRGSGNAPDPAAQTAFVLQNPLRFIAVAVQSILEGDGFLFDLGRLGHMDMVLPLVSGLSLASLLLASLLGVEKNGSARPFVMWVLLAIALVYCAAALGGMYINDTDLGSIRITGQQPRYFLPAFLLLGVAGSMLAGRLLRPRGGLESPTIAAEDVTLWLAAAVALVAAVLLVQNYFIGQWIPRAEGGWKLVNLYGWVKT